MPSKASEYYLLSTNVQPVALTPNILSVYNQLPFSDIQSFTNSVPSNLYSLLFIVFQPWFNTSPASKVDFVTKYVPYCAGVSIIEESLKLYPSASFTYLDKSGTNLYTSSSVDALYPSSILLVGRFWPLIIAVPKYSPFFFNTVALSKLPALFLNCCVTSGTMHVPKVSDSWLIICVSAIGVAT